MLRVIQEARPTWIVGENVAGIINMELDKACADLEAEGYEVEPIIIPACAVNAPHKRDRVWIISKNVANPHSGRLEGAVKKEWDCRDVERCGGPNGKEALADPMCYGGKGLWEQVGNIGKTMEGGSDSKIYGIPSFARDPANEQSGSQSFVGRVANGIPNRVHRLKGLGNAIVPQVAYQIIKGIKEVMEQNGEN